MGVIGKVLQLYGYFIGNWVGGGALRLALADLVAEHGGLLLRHWSLCSLSGGPRLLSLRTRSPGVARQLPSFLAPQEKKAKEGAKINTHVGVSSDEQGSVV
jgi:hypothetical protein